MPDHSTNLVQQTLIQIVQLADEGGLSDFLLIGGNAVIAYGVPRFTRDVDFVIPESAEQDWRSLMDNFGFQLFHGNPAFLQFEDVEGERPRVDLMIVNVETWGKLSKEAHSYSFDQSHDFKIAAPEHLVAMKLKALQATGRRSDATDWGDIVELTRRIESISLDDPEFRELVMKFGSEEIWDRLVLEVDDS